MRRLVMLLSFYGVASAAPGDLSVRYADSAKRILDAAVADERSLDRLEFLCDRIGNRLSGSASLERAVLWGVAEMKRAGLENVRAQPVKVPHWVRGAESATLVAPIQRNLMMLGIGNSVGTPPDGITAEVLAVNTFDELDALPRDRVKGRIVLFDAVYQGYGRTVAYRTTGASKAAALGAVAVLVRSVTPLAMRTPHTGTLIYSADAPRIPAAALTVEDAESIHRMLQRGETVRISLKMGAQMQPDADSANVMGEILGTEKPEEIVAVGGHLDSWDVGQGAQDDGSGIMASLEAAALIHKLGLKPRRTIRVVFWVNEENGGAGGRAYRAMVGDAIKNHVAAIEMDGGAEKPLGFGLGGASPQALALLKEIGTLLAPIGANQISPRGGGSDIEPLMESGVPGLSEFSSGTHYFDWHHTEADTFDKINAQDFRQSVGAMAVMTYILADMPGRL